MPIKRDGLGSADERIRLRSLRFMLGERDLVCACTAFQCHHRNSLELELCCSFFGLAISLLSLLASQLADECRVLLLPDEADLIADERGLCQSDPRLAFWTSFEEDWVSHTLVTVNVVELLAG